MFFFRSSTGSSISIDIRDQNFGFTTKSGALFGMWQCRFFYKSSHNWSNSVI